MKKSTVLPIFALSLALLFSACGKPSGGEEIAALPEQTPQQPYTATLTVCGDMVIHEGMNIEAKTAAGYDYTKLFEDVAPYIADSDYALACLETTFPKSGDVRGYPMFASPEQLAYDLKTVGFDLIATASNHCMDSYQSGLIDTLDVLDNAGLDHVGTYRSQAERDEHNGILLKEINGIKIAFLDYTYGTNGIPMTGFEYAANVYNRDYLTTLTDITYDAVKADMAAARAMEPDFIAVICHWGAEYITTRQGWQTTFADFLFAEGANLVLGGHPHVPEPMEIRTVTDANGNEKQGFLCYCLGNLLSCMNDRYTNLTAILQLKLSKSPSTGEASIESVGYVPVMMADAMDHGIGPDWRYKLIDINSAIADYDAGETRGYMNNSFRNILGNALSDIHGICGEDFDVWGQWLPEK